MPRTPRKNQGEVLAELLKQNAEQGMAKDIAIMNAYRPKTHSECPKKDTPCLFLSCKHNLYLDVNQETGTLKLNFPDKEPWELIETCALRVADLQGITLEEVGNILNLTRERIRQIEVTAKKKILSRALHGNSKPYAEHAEETSPEYRLNGVHKNVANYS